MGLVLSDGKLAGHSLNEGFLELEVSAGNLV